MPEQTVFCPLPVLGFAAFSGTGKTTLLCRLIPLLAARGVHVALIKHAHHDFDIDTPGKDSYELRKAGAGQVLIASDRRRALLTEHVPPRDPRLEELVAQLDLEHIDLVLVEGFRQAAVPKIELWRPALNRSPLWPDDPDIIAVATDAPVQAGDLPVLDLNDPSAVSTFIIDWLQSRQDRP